MKLATTLLWASQLIWDSEFKLHPLRPSKYRTCIPFQTCHCIDKRSGTCREWQLAICLLRHLQNSALSPNTTTYNAVINTISWPMSCKLLSEMNLNMIQQDVKTPSFRRWNLGLGNLAAVLCTSQRQFRKECKRMNDWTQSYGVQLFDFLCVAHENGRDDCSLFC